MLCGMRSKVRSLLSSRLSLCVPSRTEARNRATLHGRPRLLDKQIDRNVEQLVKRPDLLNGELALTPKELTHATASTHCISQIRTRHSSLIKHEVNEFLWSGVRKIVILVQFVGLDENGEKVKTIVLRCPGP